MNILVTGGAGFIGSHLVDCLLERGDTVDVIDNFDPFYDPAIKEQNIAPHLDHPNYKLHRIDIRDEDSLNQIGDFEVIVHLAAKAGVRPSIEDPAGYQEVNVMGTQNLLEFAAKRRIDEFVFASSSSVYGVNPNVPWREDDFVLQPISPYASTKVSGELIGHVYSHLYGMRFLALRFFTVYGPRQRPDLAIHKFTKLIDNGETVPFFGDGSASRDYTYVADTVDGILGAIAYQKTNYEIVNLGNDATVTLNEMVETIEETLGKKANLKPLGDQPGDVPRTWANIEKARNLLGYNPSVTFPEGVRKFVEWRENCY